jgi:NADPH-dependent curcumin reductase CurA
VSAERNREIRLRERPVGLPTADTFELVEVPRPEPGPGEFLVRNRWMSVDPYMRGRMREGKNYVAPYELGCVLEGGCVGEVVESRHDGFRVGEFVMADFGWRDGWVSNGDGVTRVDPSLGPIQAYLGCLGMPGLTAYVGLQRIAELKEGESVFVTAAAGAVGSVAAQIARARGCRVAGSAGSDAKVEWLREEAGLDAAFNYKTAGNLRRAFARAVPDGIDVYFDNVGGAQLETGLLFMKHFGRVVACGMIDAYNAARPEPGPRTLITVIPSRLRIQGFIVYDHEDLEDAFRRDMARWIAEGRVKWKETVVEGLENAPAAFLGLFSGENLGKMLVRI